MKKVILIVALAITSLLSYGNEVKIQNFYSAEKLDSIKTTLNRDGIFINLNLPTYKDKLYLYDNFIKYSTDECIKYETTMFDFNSNERIGVNVLFYKNGINYIVLKNLNISGGLVKYKLNS